MDTKTSSLKLMKGDRGTRMVFFALGIAGLMLFFIGAHNIDTAWNMKWTEATYDVELVDVSVGGDKKDADIIYLNSFYLINIGIALVAIFFGGMGFIENK